MAIRLLYVPNEHGDFRQVGFRRPLANLVANGLIDDVKVFSLLWRVRGGRTPQDSIAQLIEAVRQFQPDVVLMQHLAFTGIGKRDLEKMRSAANFDLIYHEADPYSRWLHPLRPEARAVAAHADVVFTVGDGVFAENFRRNGARDVRFESHCFEPERYPFRPTVEDSHRDFDVVVVANRNQPRFRGHPNWRDRIRFVELLQKRFGRRLAIYGKNWVGESARGPVRFDRQQDAIRSGWISANWDHYATEPNYFSNRLPISLAAGSIHATTWHPGYDEYFLKDESAGFLITRENPSDLVATIGDYLESTSPDERIHQANLAQEYAYSRFRQDDQLVRFLNFSKMRVDPIAATAAWDEAALPLEEI